MNKARILAVILAMQSAGCGMLQRDPVPDAKATLSDRYIDEYAGTLNGKDATVARQYINAASSFPALSLAASKPNPEDGAIKTYMQAGFSLANLYCSLYFRKLTRDQALLDYQRTQISLASGLATGLMGIFDAGSAATGATGAALGFLGASLDNINTSFLLAPKVESLEKLVVNAHVTFVNGLDPKDYETFPQAQTLVNRYAAICSFRGLKELVDQSVANAQTSSTAGVVSVNNQSATEQLKKTLGKTASDSAVTQ